MTPYEAVYGRAPPSLLDYLAGTSPVAEVDNLLIDRAILLQTLRDNLQRAQQRMWDLTNAHCQYISF